MRLQRLMVPLGPPSASRSLPSRSCHVTQSFVLEMMVRTTKKFVGLPIIFLRAVTFMHSSGFSGGNLDVPAQKRLGR